MLFINGINCSLDRLEFYIDDIPDDLLRYDYQEWKPEARSEWVRKIYVKNEILFLIKLNQKSYSNHYSKFPFKYKVRTNPADFQSSYKDYFLQLFGEQRLESTRLYRLDPSVCLKKNAILNLETLRNCTYVNYQQRTDHYIYKEKFRRGIIENFLIGGDSSRYVFYDLSLKYSAEKSYNHKFLLRKTGHIDDQYICIEHQMWHGALCKVGLYTFKDLYKLEEADVFKGIFFLDTFSIIRDIKDQRLLEPSKHYFGLLVLRHGLHNARKILSKQRNFSKTWRKKLGDLREANLEINLKSFIEVNFKSSLNKHPDRLEWIGVTKCRKKFEKSWATVNPFKDVYFNQNHYLNHSHGPKTIF